MLAMNGKLSHNIPFTHLYTWKQAFEKAFWRCMCSYQKDRSKIFQKGLVRELVEALTPFFCPSIGKNPGTASTEGDECTRSLLCLITISKTLLVEIVCRFLDQQSLRDTRTQGIVSVDPISKIH